MKLMTTAAVAVLAGAAGAATVCPQETDEALINPGMGLTQYHMAGRMWAYGATIPPGDTLAWFPGVSTVYFRLLWSELEPEEGVYRWDLIDAIANNWVRDGKQICIRVICCNHTKNATPDFVREAGAKGTWFRYQRHGVPADFPLRWEPIYDDPVYLAKYENFLKAFAKRYDGNPAVAFVDIGSFGLYGEGHTGGGSHPLDRAETDRMARLHMDLHRRLLPKTLLVISDDVAGSGGQEPEAPTMAYARKLGIAFRDDSIFCSPPQKTAERPEGSWWHSHWARPFAPETPVIIEPGHWVSCDMKGTWIKERILECIERHQASYFGIHGFPRPFLEAHRDVLPAVNRRLGYRFALLKATWPDVVRPDEPVTVESTWINRGVSWLHAGASLTWNLLDARGTVCWSSTDGAFDFRSLDPTLDGVERPQTVKSRCVFGHDEPVLPFDNVARAVRKAGQDPGETYVMLKPGRYTLAVSVGRADGLPTIALPLADGKNRIYPLGPIEVRRDGKTAEAAPGKARLYRTTDEAPFREREMTFATTLTGPGAAVIDLDAARPRHDYLGLGVSFPESSSFLWSRLPEAQRREVMDLLWTERGAGLSIGRIHLGASDYSMRLYTYDDVPGDAKLEKFSIDTDRAYVLPAVRAALAVNPDIFFFASPWSPPAWMKTGGTLCGGSLKRACYPAYAQYFSRFVDAYAKEGVKVSAVTPQNEPCTEQGKNSPTCLWSAEDESLFVRDHLSKAFAAAGQSVQIWAHDHNFNEKGVARVKEILSDGSVRAAVSAVAWHPYSGSPTNIAPLRAAYPQLPMYVTEMGPHVDRARRDLLWWADLVLGSFDAGCGAFVSWCYLLDEEGQPNITPGFGCGGLLEIDSWTGTLSESEQFRFFRHIGPFVRRGAKILNAPLVGGTGKWKMDGVRHVAFRNPDGSAVVVFAYRGKEYERRQVQLKVGDRYQTVQLLANSVTTVVLPFR